MKFEATLHPLQFDQPHPSSGADTGYRGRILSTRVEFGIFDKYEAILDNGQSFDALAAPCIIHFANEKSLKCTVEIEDETMFMLNRYGRNSYNELVRLTVVELSKAVGNPISNSWAGDND